MISKVHANGYGRRQMNKALQHHFRQIVTSMTQSCVATMVVFAHCTLCIERRERTDLSEYIGSMDVSQIAQHMQMPAERI
jgi:hypothetical protein